MMKKALVLMVCLSVLAFCGSALAGIVPSGTVTFEDLYPGSESNAVLPPAGYGGFNWSADFGVITKNYHPGSGYDVGTIGYMAGYTRFANDVYFEGVGGDDFTFIGAFINAAWDATEKVTVNGYLDGSLVYTKDIITNNTAPNWFDFKWNRVDKVEFQPDGQHIAIDNISHCNPTVPLPGAVFLFAPGIAGLIAVRRRMKG